MKVCLYTEKTTCIFNLKFKVFPDLKKSLMAAAPGRHFIPDE